MPGGSGAASASPTKEKVTDSNSFIGGGPFRIFLHLLLRGMHDNCDQQHKLFSQYTELLRFILLKEITPFLSEVIEGLFRDDRLSGNVDPRERKNKAFQFVNNFAFGSSYNLFNKV